MKNTSDSTSDPQIKIEQLESGRAWAERNIGEDTLVFAEGDRNHIRHASERVNTTLVDAREQPYLGIIQAWDAFCDALNHAAIVPLHSGDFTFVRKIGYESVSSVLDVFARESDFQSLPRASTDLVLLRFQQRWERGSIVFRAPD